MTMATKAEIKDSAYYCFAHYGYEGTTMQDIAKAVGLKKQSLYSHFQSKEELYLTVLQEQQRKVIGEIKASLVKLRGKPLEDLLKGLFNSYVSIFLDREMLLLWKRTLIYFGSDNKTLINAGDTMTSPWDMMNDDFYQLLEGYFRHLNDESSFRTFLISYMLMIQGYLDWMLVMGHNETAWSAVWKNYWNGATTFFLK